MKIYSYILFFSVLVFPINKVFSQSPEIPQLEYVTVNQTTSLPVIHWSYTTPSLINGYAVKRFIYSFSSVPDNTWHTIKQIDNPNVFLYEDNSATYGAANPDMYPEFYEVTAFKINGTDTTYSLPSVKHKTVFLNGTYDYCSNSISLIWNNYVGWGSDFKYYEVFCKENNGSFNKLTENSYNDTSFVYSNLNYNSNYTFYIKAVRNDGIESVSNLKIINTQTINLPAFLRIDSVIADDSEIKISINYDSNADAENYFLYKSASKNTDFQKTDELNSSEIVNHHFSDKEFDKNIVSYYYAAASDYCGNIIIRSDTVSNIALFAEAISSVPRKNNLSWNDMYQDSVYKIYRSIKGYDFELIHQTENHLYEDNIQTIFENQFSGETTPGKFYYYVTINNTDFFEKSNLLTVLQQESVIFPNAFNPKSTVEENRVFKPKSAFISDYQLTIYGSYGDVIFESKNPDFGWNGNLKNGKLAPVSSYLYFVSYKNASGKLIKYKNYVTLVY